MQTWHRHTLRVLVTSAAYNYEWPQCYLYSHPAYLSSLSDYNAFSFLLFRADVPDPVAVINYNQEKDQNWCSFSKAPFGGIVLQADCSKAELQFLINCVCEFISDRNGCGLTIKAPASCYGPNVHNILHEMYSNTGFCVVHTHQNHYFFVNNSNFFDRIHRMEQRRLRKCRQAGFKTRLDLSIETDHAFNFIRRCYAEKGYTLSISLQELKNLRGNFPDKYLIFTVENGLHLAGLIVGVRVREDILYIFLSAFESEFRKFSPVVLLMEAVYEFCQTSHISLLDLGTSLDQHGQPKKSLMQFKERLGAVACDKVTYHKKLAL